MSWRRSRWHRERFGPPPWWPENEPWPPRGRDVHLDTRRRQVLRRVWLAWLLMFAGIWAVGSVVRYLNGATAPAGGPWSYPFPFPPPFFAFGIFAIVFAVVTAIVTRRLAAPVADLIAAAERVATGDYAVRVEARGPAPVRSVATAFNGMASRLAQQDELRRQLMADVAHELRTPLTIVQGRLEGLLDGVYPRDDRQIEGILADTRVLARLVEDLRTIAQAESGTLTLHREPTDIGALIDDVAAAVRPGLDAHGIAIDVDVAPDVPTLDVDAVRLREVLMNLIGNAERHTPSGGRVTIRMRVAGGQMAIEVEDTGAGIAADDLPHVFDRFYKGRGSTGSGLGLAIARGIVEAHGGTIRAASRPGQGTRITTELPMPR